jgi:uncharacterized protein DUF222
MSTSVSLQGRELIAAWFGIDRGKAAFVVALAEFDASGAWKEDGHGWCASWLADKCEMSRSDAFTKLKVSRELTRRHAVRVAFEAGLPYSKVLWLVALEGVDEERDEQFVAHAATDSVRVLEERVRNWNEYHRQDQKPSDLDDHYGIIRWRGFGGGLGKVVIEAPDDMLDALFAAVDAYGEFLRHSGESRHWTSPDSPDAESDPQDRPRPRAAQRLDWLFDLLHEVKLGDERKLDPYSASVGVTIQYEDLMHKTGTWLSDQGSTLSAEAVRRLCCDAGIVRIVVKGQSEILDLGREQRLFSRAQRRAIRFRHGHRCAVRGCGRRITQIHHILWWDDKGETCIDNGIPLCSFHHHLVHEGGWQVVWDATTGITRLEGPRGQILATTASFLRAA